MLGKRVPIVRLILSLATALCLLWSPPAYFAPAGATTAQGTLADHDHNGTDDAAHDWHSGHHHDGTVADHIHDGSAATTFAAPHLYQTRPGWYGPSSVLADPGWPNDVERPPRAAAAS